MLGRAGQMREDAGLSSSLSCSALTRPITTTIPYDAYLAKLIGNVLSELIFCNFVYFGREIVWTWVLIILEIHTLNP